MDKKYFEIQNYITHFASPESTVLTQLRQDTLTIAGSHMLSGHLQGRLLSLISCMIHPKNILEIGTYTGYSALCLLEGIQKDGKLYTIDKNQESIKLAQKYFQKSGMENQICQYFDKAEHILSIFSHQVDLVFIDADKKNIGLYYDLIFEKVTSGGVILVDNVLWKGKVLEEKYKDTNTQSIKNFTKKIHLDKRVNQLIIPIRDGLMLIVKK